MERPEGAPRNFEKIVKYAEYVAKNEEKPFFVWFQLPENPILDTQPVIKSQ